MGGPGNQFYQYSFAKKLAIIFNTDFKLDLEYNKTIEDSKHGVYYVLDKYNAEQKFADPESVYYIQNKRQEDFFLKKIKNLEGIPGRFLRKVFRFFPKYYYLSSSHIKDHFNDSTLCLIEKIKDDIYLDGYWAKYLFFNDIIDDIRRDLKVKNEFKNNDYHKYRKIIENSICSVSLHVRRGTYELDFIKQYFGLLPLKYYRDAFDFIKLRFTQKIDFFIFSNDLLWAEQNLTFVPNKTFINCGFGNDFLENELMSLCEHNIIANSTYSWWAAYLNNNPNKVVIVPRIWYTDKNAQKKYEQGDSIPKYWIKL
jgi:hypothetical protein